MRGVGRSGDRTTTAGGRPVYASGHGSPDVMVNRRAALRLDDPILDRRGAYASGEATVRVNGRPLVGHGDDATCARSLSESSPNVLVGRGRVERPGHVPAVLFHLHVDADRDGVVDDDFSRNATWEAGRGRFGAILPVNCDDDAVAPRPHVGGSYDVSADARAPREDYRKAGRTLSAADLPDVARLEIRRDPRTRGRSTAGWKLAVVVSRPGKIRIFDRHAEGGTEIVGPDAGARHTIDRLDRDVYAWAMEATQFAGRYPWDDDRAGDDRAPFDGTVRLTLELFDPSGVKAHEEQCVVRAAPWIMFNHFDPTEEVLVVAQTGDPVQNNDAMVADLADAVRGAGVKLTVVDAGGDVWMQDVMEPGFSSHARADADPAGRHLPVVCRSARFNQSVVEDVPRKMCGPGFGYVQGCEPTTDRSSLDSFGNLECVPPYVHPTTGETFRFGRIVYGTLSSVVARPRADTGMRAAVVELLHAQRVQKPIAVETGWLLVGHVDEFLSFVPMNDARHRFRVAVADALLGRALLVRLRERGLGATPMSWAQAWTEGGNPYSDKVVRTVDEALALPDLEALACFVADQVERAVAVLRREVGLVDDDFVRLPVLFNGRRRRDGRQVCNPDLPPEGAPAPEGPAFDHCIAQTPGVVNGLIVTRGEPTLVSARTVTYVMPRPYGPVAGGRCVFETEIVRALGDPARTGVTPRFVDDYWTYHLMQGEVHCGTNSVRKPPIDRFWWEQDVV